MLATFALTALLAACGGGDQPPGADRSGDAGETQEIAGADGTRVSGGRDEPSGPAGSQSNPVDAKPKAGTEGAGPTGQGEAPVKACALVTRDEAEDIFDEVIAKPVEAPQGPTCVYRSKDGTAFASVAIQPQSLNEVKRFVKGRKAVSVEGEQGFCGTYGQPMLYVPLADGRVLSVAAPCPVAKRFAATAVRRLDS